MNGRLVSETAGWPPTAVWIGIASGLLLVGGSVGAAVASWASAGPTSFFEVIVLKGLWPQLLVMLGVLPVLRRYRIKRAGPAVARDAARPAPGTLLVELAVLGALAYGIVAPTLLTVAWPGWPALHMATPEERLGSFVALTTGTVVTGFAAGLLWRWRHAVNRDD